MAFLNASFGAWCFLTYKQMASSLVADLTS